MSSWFKGKKEKKANAPKPPEQRSGSGASWKRWGDNRDPNSMEVKWQEHENRVGSKRRMSNKLECARWMKGHKIFSMPKKTPDGEYEAAFIAFSEIEKGVIDCSSQLCKYQKSLRKYSGSTLLLSTAFGAEKGCGHKYMPPGAEQFIQASETMKSNMDNKLIGAMETRVLSPLLEKALKLASIMKQAQARTIAKYEYDYYFEKYRGLQEKGADTEKAKERLVRNQQNAQESASELKRLTEPLLATFKKYTKLGEKLIAAEFETLKAAHQVYFKMTSETMEKLENRKQSAFNMPSLSGAVNNINPFNNKSPSASDEDSDDRRASVTNAVPQGFDDVDAYPSGDSGDGKKYQAMYDYETAEDDELGLTRGDIIEVTDDTDESWWRGTCNGKEGLFPANYVEPYPSSL